MVAGARILTGANQNVSVTAEFQASSPLISHQVARNRPAAD